MRFILRFDRWRAWSQDSLLRRIIRNSGYLFSSNAISIFLTAIQGILAARLLGVAGYGLVAGVVIPFVSNVHRLLSFRMSELVVKYLGQYLVEKNYVRAGAIVKGAAIIEAATSVIAFLILLLSAPLAAQVLAHDSTVDVLIAIYGVILLLNGTYETALGVLQTTRQFKWIAGVSLLQNVLTTTLIFFAYLGRGSVLEVLLAYLAGKGLAGLMLSGMAFFRLNQELGIGWHRAGLRLPWRELARFAVSTNLHATINLIVRDSETLLITALRSTTEAGFFKIALGVINLVLMPIEPFISTTYAEISRSLSQRSWTVTRRLLKRVSWISFLWTAASGGGLVLTGYWLIPFVYGVEYRPAYPALVVLLVGYGMANIFNWNRSLLLALEMPIFPLKVSALVGLFKTVLTLVLVPSFGYVMEAALLSGYFISSIGWMVRRGLDELKNREIAVVPG